MTRQENALKFLKELSYIIGSSYEKPELAVAAIRSTGAYEDSGLYHVNIKGAGSFAFKVVNVPNYTEAGDRWSVLMLMAYPEDLDE